VSARWSIIVSHESIMGKYSGNSSRFCQVLCLFVAILNQNFGAA